MIKVKDHQLQEAAEQGMDEFVSVFTSAILESIGGSFENSDISQLNSDQVSLIAYVTLRDEIMDGGFVQLIHNGYGPFFFRGPFAKAMKEWGLDGLSSLIKKAHRLYDKHHKAIEVECSEDEFMQLFEQFPMFDDLDDDFVENEETWTEQIAHYIDDNIEKFAIVEK